MFEGGSTSAVAVGEGVPTLVWENSRAELFAWFDCVASADEASELSRGAEDFGESAGVDGSDVYVEGRGWAEGELPSDGSEDVEAG